MLVLNFLCVSHILFYHVSWLEVFQLFQFSVFLVRTVSRCVGHLFFFRTLNINFKKISFIAVFIVVFYDIFIKLRYIFNPLKTIYSQLLGHFPSIHIIYSPILRCDVITTFHVIVVSFPILINSMTYSTFAAIYPGHLWDWYLTPKELFDLVYFLLETANCLIIFWIVIYFFAAYNDIKTNFRS